MLCKIICSERYCFNIDNIYLVIVILVSVLKLYSLTCFIMKRLISSEKNSVAINSNELINISDIYVYKHLHFISCSEHRNRIWVQIPSQLRWHSGAAPIGQYFCNRRWLAAAAATLLTRFCWERRKGGSIVDIDYRFVVVIRNWIPTSGWPS